MKRICRCSTPVRVQDGNGVEFCDDEGGGCGGVIPSPELEAILALSRDFKERLDDFGRRIERLEATVARENGNGAAPSTNGAAAEKRILTSAELAARWNTTTRAVNRWRVAGKLPSVPVNGRHFGYRLEDIEEFESKGGLEA